MTYTIYILYSQKTGKYYTGQTKDIENRLKRHNNSLEKSTKFGVPWKLVHTVECNTRSEAVLLERKIKKRGAKRFLENLKFDF